MSQQIKTRLKHLLLEKSLKDGSRVTYDMIHQATGISTSTLVDWANNRVSRFDENTILALCDFFRCDIGDLLVISNNGTN